MLTGTPSCTTLYPDQGDLLSWELLKRDVYGLIDEDGEGGYNFKPMMDRYYRRRQKADAVADGKLTKLECQAFLHPEYAEYMRDIMVIETLEDMDVDKDGSLRMYILVTCIKRCLGTVRLPG